MLRLVLLVLTLGRVCESQAPPPSPPTQVSPTYSEEGILLAFKAGITNWDGVAAAWGLAGWEPGVLVCTWGGIQCSPFVEQGSRVTGIKLGCRGCRVPLRGRLVSSLQMLQFLEVLHLGNNSLGGDLPVEWGDPESFPALLELDLNDNEFTGPFPDSWSIGPAFNSLFNIQVANNRLTGTFPNSFALTNTSFINLLQFNIGGNQFTGPLPNYINGMITMSLVGLQNNRFTGTLPPDWGTQAFLVYGTVNSTQALEYLWLHGNNLSGMLPDAWAAPESFTVMKEVTLGDNPGLTGTLPAAWGARPDALPLLERINASRTGLSGPLPPEWGPYPSQLTKLYIDGNNITGTVPASWTQLAALERIVMQPGNPDMCITLPQDATLSLCVAGDFMCLNKPEPSNASNCQAVAATAASAPASDSSSFPVAAVAVPVAVVGAAAIAAVGLFAWQRQRTRRAVTAGLVQQLSDENKAEWAQQDAEQPPSDPPHNGTLLAQLGTLQLPSSGSSAPRSVRNGSSAPRSPPNGSTSGARDLTRDSIGGGSSDGADAEPLFTDLELQQILPDWQIDPQDIQIMKRPDGSDWRLGSGGFATVYKAMHNGVQPVAVKVLSTTVSHMKRAMSQAAFAQEIAILRACRNANILQFQGACVLDSRLVLVTEYMEGGNLTQNLAAKKVNWYRKGKKIALHIAKALVYLHSRRIVHLDIKSANVLLQRDGTAKLGDVGLAKIMAGGYVSGTVGTLAWSAPELLMGRRCGAKADIFSFGVVLWEIATGEMPQRGQMRDPIVPDECPAEMVAIMQRCFALDPTTRPTAAELVELLAVVPGPPPHPHLHLQLSSMPSIPLQTSTGMHAASTDRGSAVDSGMVAAVAADGAGGRSISSRELQGSAPPPTHDRWQHERPPFVLRPVPSGSPFERARAARQVPEGEGPAKPCQLPERAGSLTGASPFSQVQP